MSWPKPSSDISCLDLPRKSICQSAHCSHEQTPSSFVVVQHTSRISWHRKDENALFRATALSSVPSSLNASFAHPLRRSIDARSTRLLVTTV